MRSGLTTTCLCAQREESVGSERAWLERRLEKALEAEQAACDRAQSLERQCATLDEEVNTPLCSLMIPFSKIDFDFHGSNFGNLP